MIYVFVLNIQAPCYYYYLCNHIHFLQLPVQQFYILFRQHWVGPITPPRQTPVAGEGLDQFSPSKLELEKYFNAMFIPSFCTVQLYYIQIQTSMSRGQNTDMYPYRSRRKGIGLSCKSLQLSIESYSVKPYICRYTLQGKSALYEDSSSLFMHRPCMHFTECQTTLPCTMY